MPDKITSALKVANMPAIPPPLTTRQSAQVLHTTTTNPIVFAAGTITTQKELLETNSTQAFCLRWNNYQLNLISVFDQLLQNQEFVDVTLACDGSLIKAHKMVLSACSPYFQKIFADNPCKHPVIIMKDIRDHELKAIVEFMYKGEINVIQDQIGPLLRVAEMLKIRGLADVSEQQSKVPVPVEAIPAANLATNDLTQTIPIKQDIDNGLNGGPIKEVAVSLATMLTPPVECEPPQQLKTPRKGVRNTIKRNVTPSNHDPEIDVPVQTKKQKAVKADLEKPIMVAKLRTKNRKTKKNEKSTADDIFYFKHETAFNEMSTMDEENKVRLTINSIFFSVYFLFLLFALINKKKVGHLSN